MAGSKTDPLAVLVDVCPPCALLSRVNHLCEACVRSISSEELWVWVVIVATGVVLALIGRSTKPIRRELERQEELVRRRLKHLWDPLAGDSYWGSVRPSIYLPIALLVLGAFALRWIVNPIPGILLLGWAVTLAVAIRLDRANRRRTSSTSEQPPDILMRWIRAAVLLVASLVTLTFIHELVGIVMLLITVALAAVIWRDHRRLIAEEFRRQEESRTVIRDVRRMTG